MHVHAWQPLPGHRGRYTCACGAQGWRAVYGIRVQVAKRTVSALMPDLVDARPRGLGGGGRIPPCPSLDEIERGF